MPEIVPIFEPAPGVVVENITFTEHYVREEQRTAFGCVYEGRTFRPGEVVARPLVRIDRTMSMTILSPTKPHGVAERMMTGESVQMGGGVQAWPTNIHTQQERRGVLRRVVWVTQMEFILTGDPREMSLEDPLPIEGAQARLVEAQRALPEP